jgi:hypothetical protein
MTPRPRGRRSSGERRRTRGKAESGRRFAIVVFVVFAAAAALAAVLWSDSRQGLAAAGFVAGAGLMLARPGIERRRRLQFASPPGGAERVVLVLACGASVGLIRLAQVTAGTDNPPTYLLTAIVCWGLSLAAAWASGSLPPGEVPGRGAR